MRASLFLAGFLLGSPALGQDVALETKPTRWRIGFETLDAPGAAHIGLVGIHHDLLAPWKGFRPLYLGLGGYAAVGGDEGGFYLGGITLGTLYRLLPEWYLDAGVFLGGGGGGGVPGGGLALRPFVALERALGLVALRAELTGLDLDEFDGDLHLALGISLPSELLLARPVRRVREIPATSRVERQVRVAPRYLWIDPQDATARNGSVLDRHLSLVGLGVDYFVTPHLFLPVEAYGATGGDVAGFGLVSAGLGVSAPLSDFLALEGKVLVGAGGGGDVDTGGGFLWQAFGGVRAHLSPRLSLDVSGGRIEFADQAFGGTAVSVGLAWSARPIELAFDYPRGNLAREGLAEESAAISTTRVGLLCKFYRPSDRARTTAGDDLEPTLALLGLGAEHGLGGGLVFTARGFTGVEDEVGGYAEGWLGAKLELRPHGVEHHAFYVGGEFGAGGGGGLDVGSGLLGHAYVGWRGDLFERSFVTVELGRAEADHGSFEAGSASVGFGWSLARAVGRF